MSFTPDALQMDVLKKAGTQYGFAYLMEMGLGKTGTDLMNTVQLVDERDVTRWVVVCPNSFKSGWVAEIIKWGFDMDPHIFISGNDWWNQQFLKKSYEKLPVLIVNYEAIRSAKVQQYIAAFLGDRVGKITFDESIQVSVHDSAQTKAAIELQKLFRYKRILSGKWMVRGPHDIWSQGRALGKFDGFPYYGFRNYYCTMGGFKGKSVTGAKNQEELAERIDPWVFKAFKADHLKIGKRYTIREYALHPIVQEHYDNMLNEFMVWLESGEAVTVESALTKYGKLAQIQTGFIFDEDRVVQQLVADKDNTRLRSLAEFVETEMASKLLVVYHHRPALEILMRNFPTLNPAYIKGMMDPNELDAQKAKFNNDPSCRIMFLQDVASKYGHTLLGGPEPQNRCSTMAFFENGYSLDTRSQVEDRNHRRGQLEEFCSYVDFAGTDLDLKMTEALQRREEMFQVFMRLIGVK